MVSAQARESLRRLLMSSLTDTLGPAQPWEVTTSPGAGRTAHSRFVMLTLSHLAFRLLICLQFDNDAATRGYVAQRLGLPPEEVDPERFSDVICELGNELCGAMKRELGRHYRNLGLSTPNLLQGDSLPHLLAQAGQLGLQAQAHPPGGPHFGCTLAVHAYSALDFRAEEQAEAVLAGGEIELF